MRSSPYQSHRFVPSQSPFVVAGDGPLVFLALGAEGHIAAVRALATMSAVIRLAHLLSALRAIVGHAHRTLDHLVRAAVR